jgi:hypothetical protein
MQMLPPARWQLYLQRISERYAGQLVTLRQQEHARDEAHVVLWRTPLRRLSADADAEGAEVVVAGGYEEPFIEIAISPVQRIAVSLSAEQSLERMQIRSQDGKLATLLFNVEGY